MQITIRYSYEQGNEKEPYVATGEGNGVVVSASAAKDYEAAKKKLMKKLENVKPVPPSETVDV